MLNIQEFESEVLKVKDETPFVKSYHFSVPEDFLFKSAQHVIVDLPVDGKRQMKAFSISNSPFVKGYIETTKRLSESDYSKVMGNLKPGDKIKLKGPYGVFIFDEAKDAVMLAGGIGITPFKNMVEYATNKKLDRKITLIYSNKSSSDISFKEEIDELKNKNKNFNVIYTLTQENNNWEGENRRIDEEMIRNNVLDYKNRLYYVCGSPEMVNSMLVVLHNLNISDSQIKLERFTGYGDYND